MITVFAPIEVRPRRFRFQRPRPDSGRVDHELPDEELLVDLQLALHTCS